MVIEQKLLDYITDNKIKDTILKVKQTKGGYVSYFINDAGTVKEIGTNTDINITVDTTALSVVGDENTFKINKDDKTLDKILKKLNDVDLIGKQLDIDALNETKFITPKMLISNFKSPNYIVSVDKSTLGSTSFKILDTDGTMVDTNNSYGDFSGTTKLRIEKTYNSKPFDTVTIQTTADITAEGITLMVLDGTTVLETIKVVKPLIPVVTDTYVDIKLSKLYDSSKKTYTVALSKLNNNDIGSYLTKGIAVYSSQKIARETYKVGTKYYKDKSTDVEDTLGATETYQERLYTTEPNTTWVYNNTKKTYSLSAITEGKTYELIPNPLTDNETPKLINEKTLKELLPQSIQYFDSKVLADASKIKPNQMFVIGKDNDKYANPYLGTFLNKGTTEITFDITNTDIVRVSKPTVVHKHISNSNLEPTSASVKLNTSDNVLGGNDIVDLQYATKVTLESAYEFAVHKIKKGNSIIRMYLKTTQPKMSISIGEGDTLTMIRLLDITNKKLLPSPVILPDDAGTDTLSLFDVKEVITNYNNTPITSLYVEFAVNVIADCEMRLGNYTGDTGTITYPSDIHMLVSVSRLPDIPKQVPSHVYNTDLLVANAKKIKPNQIFIVGNDNDKNFLGEFMNISNTELTFDAGDVANIKRIIPSKSPIYDMYVYDTVKTADYPTGTPTLTTILDIEKGELYTNYIGNWAQEITDKRIAHGAVITSSKTNDKYQYDKPSKTFKQIFPNDFKTISKIDDDVIPTKGNIVLSKDFTKLQLSDGTALTDITATYKDGFLLFLKDKDIYFKYDKANTKFKRVNSESLRGVPVQTLDDLKAIIPREFEIRYVIATGKTYVFKSTAIVTPVETADTDNVKDNTNLGLWILNVIPEFRKLAYSNSLRDTTSAISLPDKSWTEPYASMYKLRLTTDKTTLDDEMGLLKNNEWIVKVAGKYKVAGSLAIGYKDAASVAIGKNGAQYRRMYYDPSNSGEAALSAIDIYLGELEVGDVIDIRVVQHGTGTNTLSGWSLMLQQLQLGTVDMVPKDSVPVEKLYYKTDSINVTGGDAHNDTAYHKLTNIGDFPFKKNRRYSIHVNYAVGIVGKVTRHYYVVLGDGTIDTTKWKLYDKTYTYGGNVNEEYAVTQKTAHLSFTPAEDVTLNLATFGRNINANGHWMKPDQAVQYTIEEHPTFTVGNIDPGVIGMVEPVEYIPYQSASIPLSTTVTLPVSANITLAKELIVYFRQDGYGNRQFDARILINKAGVPESYIGGLFEDWHVSLAIQNKTATSFELKTFVKNSACFVIGFKLVFEAEEVKTIVKPTDMIVDKTGLVPNDTLMYDGTKLVRNTKAEPTPPKRQAITLSTKGGDTRNYTFNHDVEGITLYFRSFSGMVITSSFDKAALVAFGNVTHSVTGPNDIGYPKEVYLARWRMSVSGKTVSITWLETGFVSDNNYHNRPNNSSYHLMGISASFV